MQRQNIKINSSDGRVDRASTSGAVDLGLIASRVKPSTLKLIFTAFLLEVSEGQRGEQAGKFSRCKIGKGT